MCIPLPFEEKTHHMVLLPKSSYSHHPMLSTNSLSSTYSHRQRGYQGHDTLHITHPSTHHILVWWMVQHYYKLLLCLIRRRLGLPSILSLYDNSHDILRPLHSEPSNDSSPMSSTPSGRSSWETSSDYNHSTSPNYHSPSSKEYIDH